VEQQSKTGYVESSVNISRLLQKLRECLWVKLPLRSRDLRNEA